MRSLCRALKVLSLRQKKRETPIENRATIHPAKAVLSQQTELLLIPPDVLGKILSQTDGNTLQSLLCSCKEVSRYVISIRPRICLEHSLQAFVDSIPVTPECTALCLSDEKISIRDPNACFPEVYYHENISLDGEAERDLPGGYYDSIKCPSSAEYIQLKVGGQIITKMDSATLHLMSDDDGYVELMNFIKILVRPEYMQATIRYRSVKTAIKVSMYLWRGPIIEGGVRNYDGITWEIYSVQSVFHKTSMRVTTGAKQSIKLDSCCPFSIGFVIEIKCNGTRTTEFLSRARLIVDGQMSRYVSGRVLTSGSKPWLAVFDTPVVMRDCYFIPMSEISVRNVYDKMHLELEFFGQNDVIDVTLWNVHKNWIRYKMGIVGLVLGCPCVY